MFFLCFRQYIFLPLLQLIKVDTISIGIASNYVALLFVSTLFFPEFSAGRMIFFYCTVTSGAAVCNGLIVSPTIFLHFGH